MMKDLKRKSFQDWHEEFNKFWPKDWKISKVCTLLGCFWPKCIMYQRSLANFHESNRKSQNWDFTGIILCKVENAWALTNLTRVLENRKNVNFHCFWPKYITFELRRYRGAIFNGTEYYAKFEGKLTCAFKNGMRNLAIFDPSTQKSPIFAL